MDPLSIVVIVALLVAQILERRHVAKEREDWRIERATLLNAARNPRATVTTSGPKPRSPRPETPPPDAVALAQIGHILNAPSKRDPDAG